MRNILLFLFIFVVATSCEKLSTIENNLWSGTGEWEIKKTENISEDNPFTFYDNGSVWLYKSRTGKMKYTLAIFTEETFFDFEITTSSMTITNTTQGSDDFGQVTEFDMVWEKNRMTLTSKDMRFTLRKK